MVAINYKEVVKLINLYIKNNQIELAKETINNANPTVILPKYLKNLSESNKIELDDADEKVDDILPKTKNISFFINQIKNSKSEEETLQLTDEALSLYPEQAFLYVTKAKVLTTQKRHKEAIEILEIGIDFAIEDDTLKDFYKLLIENYQKTGNQKEEEKYKQKLKKIQS
ncbi:MAG: hypothetical protein HC798_04455 [Polaribacter sp.]|nr:hypothetical protein [Polaribacter sp.]